jgi:tetratricopeptide (TPR) repeat protein
MRLLGFGLAMSLVARPSLGSDLRDLYFGEALYQSYQGHYFDALQRLDTELGQYHGLDEPQYDSLHYHIGTAEFDVGDFELNYRMHHRAGRAIRAVLEANVADPVRNEAAFRLARIHFQKDQPEDALQALQRIKGEVPESIKDDLEFLRANVYMALGRPHDAVEVLTRLQSSDSLKGFTAYNLGIALLQDGQTQKAQEQLDRAGQVSVSDDGGLAIRDKANLVLGTMLFESADYQRSEQSLDRVRMDGPFSNQALLRAGWAEVSAGHYDRALVPWNMLASRDVTDPAVQDALLAAPFAYSKLNVHGRAALMYGHALETYTYELERIDASIDSIRKGRFLEALVREEIRQDPDWVIRLRKLPQTPETYYLMELMASHDFHTALQNYLDLEDLRVRLVSWQTSFDAFDDIITLRKQNYEPLLPEFDAQFRELDAQIRLRIEQRKHLEKRLHDMLTAPRPDYLATADERIVAERLDQLEKQLNGADDEQAQRLRERMARVQGVLTWRWRTEYHERLTQAYEHLEELNTTIATMAERYESLVRTRQAATHSYVGYDVPISRLRTRVGEALEKVTLLMARQGHLLETVAIRELQARARTARLLPVAGTLCGGRQLRPRDAADRRPAAAHERGTAGDEPGAGAGERCAADEGGGSSREALAPPDAGRRIDAARGVRPAPGQGHARAVARRAGGRQGSRGQGRSRPGHAELPSLPRGDPAYRDDSGSDAASRRSQDREGVRSPRRRQADRDGGARGSRPRGLGGRRDAGIDRHHGAIRVRQGVREARD